MGAPCCAQPPTSSWVIILYDGPGTRQQSSHKQYTFTSKHSRVIRLRTLTKATPIYFMTIIA